MDKPDPDDRVSSTARLRKSAVLSDLAKAEAACQRCPLYKDATQVVPGEGPAKADFMLVGEQPGDKEDLAGRPFVGPAGRILDAAFEDSGIDRKTVLSPTPSSISSTRCGAKDGCTSG